MRLTTGINTRDRAGLLKVGLWPRRKGEAVLLVDMSGPHLVNALLKSLSEGDPAEITAPLAREVKRRGLEADAEAEAARRTYDDHLSDSGKQLQKT